MALQFSGGPYVNATFTGATKQNIIDGIETQLLAAGWTTVSGHNTTNLLMQCATTAGTGQGLNGRWRFRDNGGSCVNVSVESTNGSRVHPNDAGNNGGHLLPGTAKQYRVIASPYQFFVFTSSPTTPREFLSGGVLSIPPNIQGIVTEAIWMASNAAADGSGNLYNSFRTVLWTNANWQAICNGVTSGHANDGNNYAGDIGLVIPSAPNLSYSSGNSAVFRYHNEDVIQADPLMAWGLNGVSGIESKIRGQLWDALLVTGNPLMDSILSIGGHNYWVLTYANYGGGSNPRGALLLAIS